MSHFGCIDQSGETLERVPRDGSRPAHAVVRIDGERVESREMVADDNRRASDNLAGYARLPVTTGCYALGLDGECHEC